MVTIGDLQRFKAVKEKFDMLSERDKEAVLQGFIPGVRGLTSNEKSREFFKALYNPLVEPELSERVILRSRK